MFFASLFIIVARITIDVNIYDSQKLQDVFQFNSLLCPTKP